MTLIIVPENENNDQIIFLDFDKEKFEERFDKKDFVLKDEKVNCENIIKNLNENPLKKKFIKKFANNLAIKKYVNYNYQYFFELMREFQIAMLPKNQSRVFDAKMGKNMHEFEISEIFDKKTGKYKINLKDVGLYKEDRELMPIDEDYEK